MNPKPTPISAQVCGSGATPDVMLSLNPVIEPPAIRLSDAPSVIENGPDALNGELCVPAKLSGSVVGVPGTLTSSGPGVLIGFAPCVLSGSAKNFSVLAPEPTASLKVSEADS